MTVKIYGPTASRAARALWIVHELGIPFEHIAMEMKDLKNADYLMVNPNGKVPALVEGDFKLFESMAINLYLAAKHGKSQNVAPQAAEAKPVGATKWVRKGRRDPFVSPIMEKMRSAANCTGVGKRCLYIGDVSLLGIVQSSNGVIAVVMSGRHTYFLREHDPLADGNVERITSDAITLRQRSSDVMGRPVVREVTRKIGSPAV